jgi:Spy/CpxP family protein refolding chaperone
MRIAILTIIFLTSIFAQEQMDKVDRDKMEIRKERMEQLNNQRQSTMIGVQTTYLNLSTEQAEQFFPMQNEYKNKVNEVQKKYRKKVADLRMKTKDAAKFDVDKAIKLQKEMKDQLAVLEANFLKKTVNVLSNEQRTKLVYQQEKLKSQMSKRVFDDRPEISKKRDFDRTKKRK